MDWKQLLELLEDAHTHAVNIMANGAYKNDLSAYNEAVGYLRGLDETSKIIFEMNNRSKNEPSERSGDND